MSSYFILSLALHLDHNNNVELHFGYIGITYKLTIPVERKEEKKKKREREEKKRKETQKNLKM